VTRRFAIALCDLAGSVLPSECRQWRHAMRAELDHIADERDALEHAGGCVAAALGQRARDFDTRFTAGLWSAALVGAIFAAIHILCAARGIAVLRGAPDGFLDSLVRGGADAGLIASYERARPIVIAGLLGLGLTHLAGMAFLVRRDLRRFAYAWCAAVLIAILAVAIQLSVVWSADTLPSEFVAPLLQSGLLLMLLHWSRGRHRRICA
jgi:hypothetical protein